MARVTVGETAPQFELPDEHGDKVALADFAGGRVVCFFYPADGTPGCTKEVTQFDRQLDAFDAAGVTVLGISPDTPESHQRFRAEHELAVRLLCDESHEVMERYGAYGEKTLYGRTSVGVIRSTFLIGADGTLEKAWYHVRADGHAAKVLATVNDLARS